MKKLISLLSVVFLCLSAKAVNPSFQSFSYPDFVSNNFSLYTRPLLAITNNVYDLNAVGRLNKATADLFSYTIDNGSTVYSHLVDRLVLSPSFNTLSNRSFFGNPFVSVFPTNSTWGRFFFQTNQIMFDFPRSVKAFTMVIRLRQQWLGPQSSPLGFGMISMPFFGLQSTDGTQGIITVNDKFFGYQLFNFNGTNFPFMAQQNLNFAAGRNNAAVLKSTSTAQPFTYPPATYAVSYDGLSNMCAWIDNVPCYIPNVLTFANTNLAPGPFQRLFLGVVTNWSNLAVVSSYASGNGGGTFGGEIMDVMLFDTNCTPTSNTNLIGASYMSSWELEKQRSYNFIIGDSLMAAFEAGLAGSNPSPTNNFDSALANHNVDTPHSVYSQGNASFSTFTTNQVSGATFPSSWFDWLPDEIKNKTTIFSDLGHNDSFAAAPVTNTIIQNKLGQAIQPYKLKGAKYVNLEAYICWTNAAQSDTTIINSNYLIAWNKTVRSNFVVDVSLPVWQVVNQIILNTNSNPSASLDGLHLNGTNGPTIYEAWVKMYYGNYFPLLPAQAN